MAPRRTRTASSRAVRADVRATILAETRAALDQGSFRDLSIDAVMARAGLTRTAFYRYFDDLGALVQALLADATRPLTEAAARLAQDAGESGEADFRATLEQVAAVFAEHGRVLAATVAASHYDEDVEHVVVALRERFVELIAEGLTKRVRRSGLDVADPRETARALNAMNETYLLEAFGGDRRVSAEQAVEALWPVWRGLLF